MAQKDLHGPAAAGLEVRDYRTRKLSFSVYPENKLLVLLLFYLNYEIIEIRDTNI